MSRCVTWSTGRRPLTALTAWTALGIQGVTDLTEVIEVRWAPPFPDVSPPHDIVEVINGSRAECHNAGLDRWREKHGADPDVWFAVDDDIVPCRDLFGRMEAVLATVPNIYLLGCWNDGSQRQPDGGWHGYQQLVAGEIVQFGNDFNVGGAVQAIPRRTIEEIGEYDPAMVWLEDHDLTQRVRLAGRDAAIATSIHAVVLHDDGLDPTYRDEMTDTFFRKRKELLGW